MHTRSSCYTNHAVQVHKAVVSINLRLIERIQVCIILPACLPVEASAWDLAIAIHKIFLELHVCLADEPITSVRVVLAILPQAYEVCPS